MAGGPRGLSGSLVLSHVTEGSKGKLVHVPTRRHKMEVPGAVVMKNKHGHVERVLVQVSIWPNNSLSVLYCFKPTHSRSAIYMRCRLL